MESTLCMGIQPSTSACKLAGRGPERAGRTTLSTFSSARQLWADRARPCLGHRRCCYFSGVEAQQTVGGDSNGRRGLSLRGLAPFDAEAPAVNQHGKTDL